MVRTIHVELDLEPNREPIAGTLSRQDFTCPFDGWLELASAIETARADGTSAPAARPPEHSPGVPQRLGGRAAGLANDAE
jgi:hypothetical protein